jgi:hypothetical protein
MDASRAGISQLNWRRNPVFATSNLEIEPLVPGIKLAQAIAALSALARTALFPVL